MKYYSVFDNSFAVNSEDVVNSKYIMHALILCALSISICIVHKTVLVINMLLVDHILSLAHTDLQTFIALVLHTLKIIKNI